MYHYMKIPDVGGVIAREIIDSRGNPTVSVKLWLQDGSCGQANAPSGASTGKYEAYELRDIDSKRYNRKGVLRAAANVNELIAAEISGAGICSQRQLDELLCRLDGTDNKSKLGANAILPVSQAYLYACAAHYKMPPYRYIGGIYGSVMKPPIPMMNIMNGGAHAQNNMDIQEFMIVPISPVSEAEAVRVCCEIYHTLGSILARTGRACGVGDEGGYAPSLECDEDAIELILSAIEEAGYSSECDVKLALDAAASEWTDKKEEQGGEADGDASDTIYRLPKRRAVHDSKGMISYWRELYRRYPIISIEDALGEDDLCGWAAFTASAGRELMIVGDDLFTTNAGRIRLGIERGCANAVLVKPNQAGSVTETFEAIAAARASGYRIVISHRSGETEDTFIADLACGVGGEYIKTGAPCRSERTAKYNRLMEIERELTSRGVI